VGYNSVADNTSPSSFV